jgi:hypothetical protein
VKTSSKNSAALVRAVAAAAATAWFIHPGALRAATNSSGQPTQQGIGNPAVTISFSGQTALRTFDTSPAITELQPSSTSTPTEIILHDGPSGSAVDYFAPNNANTIVQLASPNFTSPDTNEDAGGNPQPIGTQTSPSTEPLQINSAIALQWHEQGSVDGFYDLVNDEVGYAQTGHPTTDPISNEALRTPSSSNPTWINTNKFTAAGTINGFSLDNSSSDLLDETYNTSVYSPTTGQNLLGGQNRVQFAVGEPAVEALSETGTPSPFATPGSAGYGLGNPALNSSTATGTTYTSLGTAGARQQFRPLSILNEATNVQDPNSATAANYASGPWNTAAVVSQTVAGVTNLNVNNVTSTPIAAVGVTYSANPGTGLQRINRSDAQWLQTTGRLQNGALFNVVARTVDTGQRIVFAANTGIDPSWAVGSNDDGNSTSSTAASAQHSIGSSLRFDGKTSGTEAATTISNSRMAVGALSVPEARAVASNAPVRALDVDFNDATDPTSGGITNDSAFVRANASTIESSNNATRYQAVLISHYNTIKTPNQAAVNQELTNLGLSNTPANQATAWADINSFNPALAETDGTSSAVPVSGIKGDNAGDVAAFISNIVNSTNIAATAQTPTSANNPADGLLSTGFLLPGLLNWTRAYDGGAITPVTLSSAAQAQQSLANSNYGTLFGTDSSTAANNQTIGTSSFYGDAGTGNTTGLSSNGAAINGAIPITAKQITFSGSTVTGITSVGNGTLANGGNYLFGNFNQNGDRDYSAVQTAVGAALSLTQLDTVTHSGSNSIFTSAGGVTNSTVVPALSGTPAWAATVSGVGAANTKGDLVALGDYNGDGQFNGQDLYLLATGASLANSSSAVTSALNSTATLTIPSGSNFADAVRSPSAVLFKNTALDYIQNYLSNAASTDPAAVAALEKSARVVLTTSGTVPAGATDLHTTDPVSGLEQYTYDPNGTNAFNKFDVNRDGRITIQDLQVVDKFVGDDTANLTDQLSATIAVDGSASTSLPQQPFSLENAQLIDNKAANGLQANIGGNGASANNGQGPSITSEADGSTKDRNILRTDFNALASYEESIGALAPGDVTLDGTVDNGDIQAILNNFGNGDNPLISKWTSGDLNDDGTVDNTDLAIVLNDFGDGSDLGHVFVQTAAEKADALEAFQADDLAADGVAFSNGQFVAVPEPASLVLLVGGMTGVLARRRRRSTQA